MEDQTCQSCGMPMAMDAKGGGSEVDGTRTGLYCSHCYENGQFTAPDLTASQMQERVRGKLVELDLPEHVVNSAVEEIPKLRRWQA